MSLWVRNPSLSAKPIKSITYIGDFQAVRGFFGGIKRDWQTPRSYRARWIKRSNVNGFEMSRLSALRNRLGSARATTAGFYSSPGPPVVDKIKAYTAYWRHWRQLLATVGCATAERHRPSARLSRRSNTAFNLAPSPPDQTR